MTPMMMRFVVLAAALAAASMQMKARAGADADAFGPLVPAVVAAPR